MVSKILSDAELMKIDTESFARFLYENELGGSWDDTKALERYAWYRVIEDIYDNIQNFRDYLNSKGYELVIINKHDDTEERLWQQENHK